MRTSNRLEWGEANSLTQRRDELTRSGRSLIDLTVLNPTLVELDYPAEEIREIFRSAARCEYDPHPLGSLAARSAVSGDYARRGIEIPPDQICITASTSESFSLLFKLLADPRDSVLVPRPGYPLLDQLAPLDGIGVESYRADAPDLSDATVSCRLISIVAPHMPLGTVPDREVLDDLLSSCLEREIVPILDEVFADYSADSIGKLSGHRAPVFRLGGISKTAGLPGVKIGWIGWECHDENLCSRLEFVADAYLSPNQVGMNALPSLLRAAPGIRTAIMRRIATNIQAIDDAGMTPRLRSTGASWTAVLAIAGDDEAAVGDLLDEGVWVQPGYYYEIAEPCLVLSLLTRPDRFQRGLHTVVSVISGY